MAFNFIFFNHEEHKSEFSAADLPDVPAFKKSWEHWTKARDEKGGIPHYSMLKNFDLRDIMGYCAIVEMNELSPVPYYRHVGTNLTLLYGQEIEGKFADQVFAKAQLQSVREAYDKVLYLEKPTFSKMLWNRASKAKGYNRLILPYTFLNNKIQFFLTVIMPSEMSIVKASDWKTADEIMNWLVEN